MEEIALGSNPAFSLSLFMIIYVIILVVNYFMYISIKCDIIILQYYSHVLKRYTVLDLWIPSISLHLKQNLFVWFDIWIMWSQVLDRNINNRYLSIWSNICDRHDVCILEAKDLEQTKQMHLHT